MCPEGAQVELYRERSVPKVLKLSSEVSECKPLVPRAGGLTSDSYPPNSRSMSMPPPFVANPRPCHTRRGTGDVRQGLRV